MASASASNEAAVLLRPRNFQWYWRSATDHWSSEGEEHWQKYTDVENEIIEDAYNEKKFDVKIDGGYMINLEHQVQYQKGNNHRQHHSKRHELDRDRSNIHLCEEQFSLAVTSALTKSMSPDSTNNDVVHLLQPSNDFPHDYYCRELHKKGKTISNVVEEAAQGIMKEGTALGKTREAQWLAEQLLKVQQSGAKIKTNSYSAESLCDIGEICVYLYTKDSFWYKLLNGILRNPEKITLKHLKTIGPFCYLLDSYLHSCNDAGILTVYRGLNLTDKERKQFMKEKIQLTTFT